MLTYRLYKNIYPGPLSDSIHSAEIEVMIYAQCAAKPDMFYDIS
jgi:hypothetical protein